MRIEKRELKIEQADACSFPESEKRLRIQSEPAPRPQVDPYIFFLDIIIEIMKWTSVAERKTCRLVCKEWFYACSQFEKLEKLSIGSEYRDHLGEVLLTLQKSARQHFHLEFNGVNFGKTARVKFWSNCGPKILSLKLINCKESSHVPFTSILKYCSKLESFALHFDELKDIFGWKASVNRPRVSSGDLTNLSVQTFEVSFKRYEEYCNTYWIQFLLFFFESFPNIVNFSFSHDLMHFYGIGMSELNLEVYPYLFDQLETIDMVRQLSGLLSRNREVKINFPSPILLNSLVTLTNITEITAIWLIEAERGMSQFTKIAEEQKNLRKLTSIAKISVRERELNSYVTDMLKIPTLHEFELFFYRNNIDWDNNCSTSLNESNVQTLRFLCDSISFPNLPNIPHLRNGKLTTLAIRGKQRLDSSVGSFLRTLPNLRVLYLSHVNDVIFKSVCTNQLELESLTLETVMDKEVLVSTNSFNQLKRLRKLIVPRNFILKDNHLDNLKILCVMDAYARIYGLRENHVVALSSLEMYQNLSSSLEVVWIDSFQPKLPNPDEIPSEFKSHSQWFLYLLHGFVKKMENLKILCLRRGKVSSENVFQENLTEQEVSSFFKHCPSLRIFVHSNTYFVKNVITKRVEEGGSKNFMKFESELWQRYVNMNEDFEFQYRHQSFRCVY